MVLSRCTVAQNALGWPPYLEVAFRSGDKTVTNALLEQFLDLFFLGLLEMKLRERSRHEKISSFL